MNKLIGAAVALVLVASLVAVGCDQVADDDCDAAGVGTFGAELAAAHTGTGGSRSGGRGPSLSKPRKAPGTTSGRSSSRPRTSHGSTGHSHRHVDDGWSDWSGCDD